MSSTFEQARDALVVRARALMGEIPRTVDLVIIADTAQRSFIVKRGKLEVDVWLEDVDKGHALQIDASIPYRELREAIEQAMYELCTEIGWSQSDSFYGVMRQSSGGGLIAAEPRNRAHRSVGEQRSVLAFAIRQCEANPSSSEAAQAVIQARGELNRRIKVAASFDALLDHEGSS